MCSLRPAVGFLRPAPPFPSIALSMGANVVGRGRGGVMDPRVSREHAEISVTKDEGELSFSLKCLGALTCVSKGGVVTTLKRDDAVSIAAGDAIHLLPKLHRFELEVTGRSAAASSAAASPAGHTSSHPQPVLESQSPAAKRHHLERGGASGSGDGGASGSGDGGASSGGGGGGVGGGGVGGGGGGGGGGSMSTSRTNGDAGGGGGSGAGGADGANDGSEDDWLGMGLG